MAKSGIGFSLSEFLKAFVGYATNNGAKSFEQFFANPKWHALLYNLRVELEARSMDSKFIGDFDWDGPTPNNRILKEVSANLDRFYRDLPNERMKLPVMSDDLRKTIEIAFNIAKEISGPFEF